MADLQGFQCASCGADTVGKFPDLHCPNCDLELFKKLSKNLKQTLAYEQINKVNELIKIALALNLKFERL